VISTSGGAPVILSTVLEVIGSIVAADSSMSACSALILTSVDLRKS
jgi:hypothetical protein